jgi:hypothetical protein
MIRKYLQFIKEADETPAEAPAEAPAETSDESKPENTDDSKFGEIKDEIKSMIEKTIENSGGEYDSFVDSFIKNPEDVKIEGFINDSDIYDFYLKWRNDIDEILNNVKFFDEVPSEINTFGLYDFTIKGTQKAVEEVLKMK